MNNDTEEKGMLKYQDNGGESKSQKAPFEIMVSHSSTALNQSTEINFLT